MAEEKKDQEVAETKEAPKKVEKKEEIKKEAAPKKAAPKAEEAKQPEKEATEKPKAVKKEAAKKAETSVEKTEKAEDAPKAESKKAEAPKEKKAKPAAKKPEKAKITNKMDHLTRYSELRTDLPELKAGDIVRVSYRVIEGGKERIQVFEGTVIALKHAGIQRTITVRKTSFGIAVERIFPLNSKLVQGIEVKRHSKVRRSKLYYLRDLKGKAARLKELR